MAKVHDMIRILETCSIACNYCLTDVMMVSGVT